MMLTRLPAAVIHKIADHLDVGSKISLEMTDVAMRETMSCYDWRADYRSATAHCLFGGHTSLDTMGPAEVKRLVWEKSLMLHDPSLPRRGSSPRGWLGKNICAGLTQYPESMRRHLVLHTCPPLCGDVGAAGGDLLPAVIEFNSRGHFCRALAFIHARDLQGLQARQWTYQLVRALEGSWRREEAEPWRARLREWESFDAALAANDDAAAARLVAGGSVFLSPPPETPCLHYPRLSSLSSGAHAARGGLHAETWRALGGHLLRLASRKESSASVTMHAQWSLAAIAAFWPDRQAGQAAAAGLDSIHPITMHLRPALWAADQLAALMRRAVQLDESSWLRDMLVIGVSRLHEDYGRHLFAAFRSVPESWPMLRQHASDDFLLSCAMFPFKQLSLVDYLAFMATIGVDRPAQRLLGQSFKVRDENGWATDVNPLGWLRPELAQLKQAGATLSMATVAAQLGPQLRNIPDNSRQARSAVQQLKMIMEEGLCSEAAELAFRPREGYVPAPPDRRLSFDWFRRLDDVQAVAFMIRAMSRR